MSGHVASQTNNRPDFHGVRVTPSGLLPSALSRPVGSNLDGMWAADSARLKMSLRAACRWCLPSLLLQLRVCLPRLFTKAGHAVLALVCSAHRGPQSKTYRNPQCIVIHAETQSCHWQSPQPCTRFPRHHC